LWINNGWSSKIFRVYAIWYCPCGISYCIWVVYREWRVSHFKTRVRVYIEIVILSYFLINWKITNKILSIEFSRYKIKFIEWVIFKLVICISSYYKINFWEGYWNWKTTSKIVNIIKKHKFSTKYKQIKLKL
jgi:hypothetical protein